jgi:O-antigen/teichoic acid export membrane protein
MDMIKIFKVFLLKFGIDGAIFYTSLGRVIQASTGVITIFFVAKFLSGIEQGFYYTFGSILAIQVFFELGLNGVITQYVAHEVSHLTWDSETTLSGSQPNLSRLSSLLHFAVKWYLLFSGLLIVVLLVTGFLFFNRYDKSGGAVNWSVPWIILTVSTTIAFLINPILAFIEGLGKVKQVAQIRLIQQIITSILIWVILTFGFKLYSIGISSILGLLVVLVVIFFGIYKKLLLNIWKALGNERVNYRKEIFPYQWKIALSWVSGYFVFQMFSPVLFATEGAVVAGQMGMTLAALNGILSLSISWMTTKVPLYSGLIAQKKFIELDRIFNKTLSQSVLINGLALAVLFLLIFILRHFDIPLGDRFLPYLPLLLMILTVFLNQFVGSWAIYLRCHKQEPLVIPSIVVGISTTISTILLGKYFGVNGMTLGYCVLTFFVSFLWSIYIFKTKKEEWHGKRG